MGIVKVSDDLHGQAKKMAKAMSRSINSQAEHWMRLGKTLEEHPELSYQEICQLFLEQAAIDDD